MDFVSKSSVLLSGILFLVLDPIFVFARFWLRWRTKSWGLDDWFCIPALVCSRFEKCTITNCLGFLPVAACHYDCW